MEVRGGISTGIEGVHEGDGAMSKGLLNLYGCKLKEWDLGWEDINAGFILRFFSRVMNGWQVPCDGNAGSMKHHDIPHDTQVSFLGTKVKLLGMAYLFMAHFL